MSDEPAVETPEAPSDAFGALADEAPQELPVEPPVAVEPALPASPDAVAAPEHQPPQAGGEDDGAEDPFAGMTMEEIEDAFEEFVDEVGPVEAAQALATLAVHARQAEMQEQFQQYQQSVEDRNRPGYEREYQAQAVDQITQLEREFGGWFDREALAAAVAADEQYFMEPDTRGARLRQAAAAIAYDRQVAYARGDDVKAQMQEYVQPRDAFGAREAAYPEPAAPPTMPQAPVQAEQPRDLQAGQFLPGRQSAPVSTVHIEGGSTPPPPSHMPADVDPAIAEIDALDGPGNRDLFGRRSF